MKVLLATPMPPMQEAPGAIPLVLYALLSGMAERHSITLVTRAGTEPGEWEAAQSLTDLGVKLHLIDRRQLSRTERWNRRWRLGSAWMKGRWPWRTVWFWDPQVQKTLDRLLQEQKFDLVAVEDNAMGAYRYRTQAPKIFTEHEVRRPRSLNWRSMYEKNFARRLLSELDWQRWQGYQQKVWRAFDRIQVFTTRDAEAIARLAPDLAGWVRVNPFGIMLPPQADAHRAIPGRVVFTGNFTHLPNVDAALWLGKEILPIVRQLSPGVQLFLIGVYPPKEVQEMENEDIRVTGPVESIRPYLEEAAVVAAPVRTGGGMRMKVLYAMAMGKAVVTTPRGAEGLAIGGETPPLCVAKDAGEFAGITASLLASPAKRSELGERARRYVERHFSDKAYASRTEANWLELVEERRG